MTYLQHQQHPDKEKVRQETTTTTISSTTTTTASSSSTMPHTSDSEPTLYSTQKSMHYTSSRASNGMKNGTSAQNHEIDNGQASPSPRLVNGGRSSSQSSNSSGNGPAPAHKGSYQGINGQHSKSGAPSSFSNHSNGSNASLPPNKSAGSQDRHHRPAHDPSDFSSGAHSWPILFAVVPPLGALVFGKSDIWSDMLTLALIAFFLYNIIKVPWELYYAARTRRILLSAVSVSTTLDPILEQRRQNAASSLRNQEFFSLLFVLASPFIGGYTLQYLKSFFSSYEDYLSALNIELFIIASGIRPLTHLISLLKARALHLQEQVHYPDSDVESLKRKVASMEAEMAQLRRAFATKREVSQVQDSVEPTLNQLTKQLKRQDKKETLLRSYAEERFATIDEKMREYDTILSYRITEEQHRSSLLFLPINILVAMVGYCTFFLPSRLAGIAGGKQQPMLKSPPAPAAIGDGFSNETHHHPTKSSHLLTGHHPSHNPLSSTRETARLY